MYRIIDLCCGIGGIRRGFELASPDFETVLSADIDPVARRAYQHIYNDRPLGDISTLSFSQSVEKLPHGYDILLAGFPCQTFSSVGKREGFHDQANRGIVFFAIADILQKTRPKALLLENVENIVRHDKGRTINTIVEVLENELNYHLIGISNISGGDDCVDGKQVDIVRNTRNFGVPQNRPRAYIVGFSKDWFGDRPERLPQTLPTGRKLPKIYQSLDELLEEDVDVRFYLSEGYLETLKKHKKRQKKNGNGFGYMVVNDAARESRIANAVLATGGSGRERNLVIQPKEHASGVWVTGKKTPTNSEGIRVMTPTEWGKLQGFVNYAFLGADGRDRFSLPPNLSRTNQYKLFGNSVSIPVIEELASFMHECLLFLEQKSDVCLKNPNTSFDRFCFDRRLHDLWISDN